MSENIKVILDIDRVCRTCLAHKSTDQLVPILENNLVAPINEVANIELTMDLALPSCICEDCLTKLNISTEFRKQIQNAEAQLKNLVVKKESNKVTVIYTDNQVVSEDCVIEEIVSSTQEKGFLILENLESGTEIPKEYFDKDIGTAIFGDDDKNTDNKKIEITDESNATNVIKWADSENSSPEFIKMDPNFTEDEEVENTDKLKQKNGASKPNVLSNFSCDFCTKKFRFEFIYQKHLIKHGIDMACENCPVKFDDVKNYLTHTKSSHPNFRPFACPKCPARYFSMTPLKVHYNIHLGRPRPKTNRDIKAFSCNICQKKYCSMPSLRKHVQIHVGEKKHKCPICGALFLYAFSLRTHFRTHTGEKPYECTVCNNRFNSSSYLTVHLRTHTAERPFECQDCHKRFVSKNGLVSHRKSHKQEANYVCDFCAYRAKRLADLNIHIRKHTGEKPYECDQCDKRYATSGNLSNHKKVAHIGLREYVCGTCSKAFGDPGTLKSHIRVHTGEKPYQCDICGARFKQSGQMTRHRTIHRTEDEDSD